MRALMRCWDGKGSGTERVHRGSILQWKPSVTHERNQISVPALHMQPGIPVPQQRLAPSKSGASFSISVPLSFCPSDSGCRLTADDEMRSVHARGWRPSRLANSSSSIISKRCYRLRFLRQCGPLTGGLSALARAWQPCCPVEK